MINVYILTGFLGAGKTTVLNNLLDSLKHQSNFVIENEFGENSVDSYLFDRNTVQLYDLKNGCVCCSLEHELFEVLDQIVFSKKKPDNVFVETTGIADVGQLISLFKTDVVSSEFQLKKTICVVDCETIEDRIGEVSEVAKQLIMADCIMLNKTGFISKEYLVSVFNLICNVNKSATIIETVDGKVNIELLYEEKEKSKFRFRMQYPIKGRDLKHSIQTITFKTENEFDIKELEFSMRIILQINYEQIYRVKGFIKGKDSNTKFLVQSAGKRLLIEPHGLWEDEVPQSFLVFIGKDLTEKAIDRILRPSIKPNLIKTLY
jgi:G3E family GTPase